MSSVKPTRRGSVELEACWAFRSAQSWKIWQSVYGRVSKLEKDKTYNSWYSLVVTQPTTNQPIYCLNRGERTGSFAFSSLRSYVGDSRWFTAYIVFRCYCGEENRKVTALRPLGGRSNSVALLQLHNLLNRAAYLTLYHPRLAITKQSL